MVPIEGHTGSEILRATGGGHEEGTFLKTSNSNKRYFVSKVVKNEELRTWGKTLKALGHIVSLTIWKICYLLYFYYASKIYSMCVFYYTKNGVI